MDCRCCLLYFSLHVTPAPEILQARFSRAIREEYTDFFAVDDKIKVPATC